MQRTTTTTTNESKRGKGETTAKNIKQINGKHVERRIKHV